jgi:hypothetical protein
MSFVFQLFEELQGLLTQGPKDQSLLEAPGLHRRAGSRAQGEGFQEGIFSGLLSEGTWPSCLSPIFLYSYVVLTEKWDANKRA